MRQGRQEERKPAENQTRNPLVAPRVRTNVREWHALAIAPGNRHCGRRRWWTVACQYADKTVGRCACWRNLLIRRFDVAGADFINRLCGRWFWRWSRAEIPPSVPPCPSGQKSPHHRTTKQPQGPTILTAGLARSVVDARSMVSVLG